MTVEVERRFEVRGRALGAVEALLQAAAQEGEVVCARTRLERPPLLDVRLRGPASAVAALHDRVRRVPGASLFRDLVVTTPGAETYPDPDVLLRIGLDPAGHAALPTATPPEPVVVAIVDSGIMARHPDLQPHVAVPDRARDATDEDGHGTMLAGSVIAAAGGSATVRLMPVKFFDGAVLPAADNAARAIRAAVAHGAAIINLSWDVGFGSDALRAAGMHVVRLARSLRDATAERRTDIACDVTDPASVEHAVTRVERELGVPDVIVNNAGVFFIKPLAETTYEDFTTTLATTSRRQLRLFKMRAVQKIIAPVATM